METFPPDSDGDFGALSAPYTAREIVALVIACGAALSILALAVGASLEIASPTGHLSQAASSVLATSLGASIGAVASYLGGRPASGA